MLPFFNCSIRSANTVLRSYSVLFFCPNILYIFSNLSYRNKKTDPSGSVSLFTPCHPSDQIQVAVQRIPFDSVLSFRCSLYIYILLWASCISRNSIINSSQYVSDQRYYLLRIDRNKHLGKTFLFIPHVTEVRNVILTHFVTYVPPPCSKAWWEKLL